MGAAARAGRDAYARACLVDASERRLASRKSIAREEDLELHLWAPHWNGGSILDFACFFATCRRFFATCRGFWLLVFSGLGGCAPARIFFRSLASQSLGKYI